LQRGLSESLWSREVLDKGPVKGRPGRSPGRPLWCSGLFQVGHWFSKSWAPVVVAGDLAKEHMSFISLTSWPLSASLTGTFSLFLSDSSSVLRFWPTVGCSFATNAHSLAINGSCVEYPEGNVRAAASCVKKSCSVFLNLTQQCFYNRACPLYRTSGNQSSWIAAW
jgi:hypothetical protein